MNVAMEHAVDASGCNLLVNVGRMPCAHVSTVSCAQPSLVCGCVPGQSCGQVPVQSEYLVCASREAEQFCHIMGRGVPQGLGGVRAVGLARKVEPRVGATHALVSIGNICL